MAILPWSLLAVMNVNTPGPGKRPDQSVQTHGHMLEVEEASPPSTLETAISRCPGNVVTGEKLAYADGGHDVSLLASRGRLGLIQVHAEIMLHEGEDLHVSALAPRPSGLEDLAYQWRPGFGGDCVPGAMACQTCIYSTEPLAPAPAASRAFTDS